MQCTMSAFHSFISWCSCSLLRSCGSFASNLDAGQAWVRTQVEARKAEKSWTLPFSPSPTFLTLLSLTTIKHCKGIELKQGSHYPFSHCLWSIESYLPITLPNQPQPNNSAKLIPKRVDLQKELPCSSPPFVGLYCQNTSNHQSHNGTKCVSSVLNWCLASFKIKKKKWIL